MNIITYLKNSQKKIHGGIYIPHFKNTAHLQAERLPCPEYVTLPMQQHIGTPCTPIVKINEHVKIGQQIAASTSDICTPIHASISGTVTKIDKITMPNGISCQAVTITSDNKMELLETLTPKIIKTKKDLINAAKECGLVGLGGAGFPTHIKLNFPKDKPIDTLLINAAECEPYITSDNRTILENTDEIIFGIYLIKKILNIKAAIIIIENNKPNAIKKLKSAVQKVNDSIKILVIDSKYPGGAEKILIKACTGRAVPCGKLPADIGCLVINVSSVAALSHYVKTGIPLVNRLITVDGSAVKTPKNVITPIGTPISEVIKFCGGYKKFARKILMGGPMMGIAVSDDTMPVLKQNNAILVLDEKDATLQKPQSCIRCGKCVQSCPMKLMPLLIEQNVSSGNLEQLIQLNITNCMECGCCSYSCPANRPLVQSIRLGKFLISKYKNKI